MRRMYHVSPGALLVALMVTACAHAISVTNSVAAALDLGAQVAAVAPSHERENQREAQLVEGAKKEGKVVFWTGGSAKDWQYVFKKFRERYPFITTETWQGSDADVYQKITMEARAGIYNVDVSVSDVEYVRELRKAGLMKKYD